MVLASSSCRRSFSIYPLNLFARPKHSSWSAYLSTGDVEVDLAAVSAHQGSKLVADTLEGTETVVFGESLEEVLEDTGLIGTGNLSKLFDDRLLVGVGEHGGAEDIGELLVSLEGLAEGRDSTGSLVESSGLGGSGVLFTSMVRRGIHSGDGL
jgi:hypothetical protein